MSVLSRPQPYFFFLQFLLSHDINFCCDFSFCRDTSLCRYLVRICLKFNEQRVFFFILYQFPNSQHQLNQFHTEIQTYILFDFQRIWIGKRMLTLLQLAPSCELLELSWNCLFFFSPCIFARAFCNIDINALSKQKLTSKVLTNHYKN